MRRYYHTDNATRSFRAGGIEFHFDPVELRAGAWRGLLSTEDEEAQIALASLVSADGPIREITAEEYEAQKKKTHGGLGSLLWRAPSAPLLPKAAKPAEVEQAPQPSVSSAVTESAIAGSGPVAFAAAEPPDELAEEEPKQQSSGKKKGKKANG